MIILVDMDGVLADFEAEFLHRWRAEYPDRPFIPLEERRGFSVREQYAAEFAPDVSGIWYEEGFFRALAPIPGGREALVSLTAAGHEVFLCTSPLKYFRYCVGEKYAWVAEHLGEPWTRRMVLTRDKTIVRGDLLVDDRPEISGVAVPQWEHVVFDQPYNRTSRARRLHGWGRWRDLLEGPGR